jgi:hypothetical protein
MAMGGVDVQQVAALDAIVERLGRTVQRLGELMRLVREAAVGDSPERLLDAVSLVEAATAQVSRLEEERQEVQASLEQALGVRGLPAVVARCRPTAEGARLEAHFAEMQLQVRMLQDEETRTAALLTSAIEIAQRMGGYVARLRGVDTPYRPRPELAMSSLTIGAPEPAVTCHPEPAGEGSVATAVSNVGPGHGSFASLRMTDAGLVS